jgi:hypothetical protein
MVLMNAAPDAIINGFQPQISSLLGNVSQSVTEFQKMSASEHMRRQRAKKRRMDSASEMTAQFPMNQPPQAFAQQVQHHIQTVTLARPVSPSPAVIAVSNEDEEREKKRKMSIQALLSLDTSVGSVKESTPSK